MALVKTARVAYIFTNVNPTKKVKMPDCTVYHCYYTFMHGNYIVLYHHCHQKVQDWQLLLLAAAIVAVEVVFTIPLLTLTSVEGDTRYTRDSENPTFVNVSPAPFNYWETERL